jgi:hypothetical protein
MRLIGCLAAPFYMFTKLKKFLFGEWKEIGRKAGKYNYYYYTPINTSLWDDLSYPDEYKKTPISEVGVYIVEQNQNTLRKRGKFVSINGTTLLPPEYVESFINGQIK